MGVRGEGRFRGGLFGAGSGLSLTFVEPHRTDQRHQMDQLPATRREMISGAFSFREIQNVPIFSASHGPKAGQLSF